MTVISMLPVFLWPQWPTELYEICRILLLCKEYLGCALERVIDEETGTLFSNIGCSLLHNS